MAGLKRKVRAYVLMESVFAMVIVMLTFAAAMLVFNVMAEGQRSYLVVKAEIALRNEAERCKLNQEFFNAEIVGKEFAIRRRVYQYEEAEHLLTLELKAITDEGKTLSEYYEFVSVR